MIPEFPRIVNDFSIFVILFILLWFFRIFCHFYLFHTYYIKKSAAFPPAYFDPSCGNAADLFRAIFFYYHIYNYLLSSLSKHYSNEIAVCHFSKLYIIYNFNNGYGRKRLKNPDTACLRSSLPCFRKLILSFNTRG